ncbi:MAG: hydrogen peroxide-inducible genes activator [Sorangiineae bacterium]|nr:hydrogen peroxide-inducible genes activator [Polyangiaceae bacterium]MEB2323125.1 hydrogen peroxide-inducible genes activator [Sorangiineae bacterium]
MDLSQVTLTQLRYAVAVADARNFRRAAERCHVSLSGLSMQVQKLEELLGVVLFDRSKKPVLVTPEGGPVLGQMRAVLRETERLGQMAAEGDEPAGPYRLGVIPTLSPTVLPLFLEEFALLYPKVELTIEELKTEDIVARLRSDTIDAGLAATPLGLTGLHEEALGLETLHAYLPLKDPLLRRPAVRQAELAKRELWVMPEGHCFRTQVLSYCGPGAVRAPRRIHFESGSFETLIHLVDRGLGATVLPALVVAGLPHRKRREQVRPLIAPVPARELGLVTARKDLRRRVSEALAALIRARLEESLAEGPARAVVLEPLAHPESRAESSAKLPP